MQVVVGRGTGKAFLRYRQTNRGKPVTGKRELIKIFDGKVQILQAGCIPPCKWHSRGLRAAGRGVWWLPPGPVHAESASGLVLLHRARSIIPWHFIFGHTAFLLLWRADSFWIRKARTEPFLLITPYARDVAGEAGFCRGAPATGNLVPSRRMAPLHAVAGRRPDRKGFTQRQSVPDFTWYQKTTNFYGIN